MLKPILLAMCITLISASGALAQYGGGNNTANGGAVNATAGAGGLGYSNSATSDVTMTENNTVPWSDSGPDPYYIKAQDNTHTSTTQQHNYQPITNNISGTGSGGSVSVGSAPFAGTNIAPGNLSSLVLGQNGVLPATTLDSFVFRMGYDPAAFGDESEQGPPPFAGGWDPLTFPTDGMNQNLPQTQ